MNKLYPLKFKPRFRDKIWGGQKIKDVLKINFGDLPNCGEAWALSGVEDNETVVANGFLTGNELNELVEIYMDDLVGGKVYEQYKNEFPILVKFIDANDWLSIQVHPDNELARKRGLSNGKTEMWYIISSEENSQLISGFSQTVNQKVYLDHLKNNTLQEILNFEIVKADDIFYMPSGRVHALGPGILLAEIQQTSDTTYRIYDWDRSDDQGKQRDLHTNEAIEAIDYNTYNDYKTDYPHIKNQSVEAVKAPYFTTQVLHLDMPMIKSFAKIDSFIIYTCVMGKVAVKYPEGKVELNMGECLLIPNEILSIEILPLTESKLLETYIL